MRFPVAVPPVVGFVLLYLIAVIVGAGTTPDDSDAPMIWPAFGIAAIWMAVSRDSRRRRAELAAVAPLTMAGLVAAGSDPAAALVEGLVTTLGAVVFAVAAGRWLPESSGTPLSSLLGLWRFLLCAVVAAAAATLPRAVGDALLVDGWVFAPIEIAALIVRDVIAILVFGSAALLIIDLLRSQRRGLSGFGAARGLECAAVFAASTAAYWGVFNQERLPIGFVLIPLTLWAAIRMPSPLVILHAAVFNCVALSYTFTGHGPYAAVENTGLSMLLIQVYVGTLASVGLAVAISRDERDMLIVRLQVSEQVATEKATMMTTVVNSMTEGLAILDHDGRLVLRNPAAGRLLGTVHTVTGEVALGSDHGFFRPDGTPLTDADLPHVRALAGEDVAPMDILIRNAAVPEGRVVRVNVARLVAGTGLYHVVVVFHDVTADRRHRDELMSFAGRVAHNLLNPLTTIEGWSEVLEQELAGHQLVERVERIQRASARMRTFLNGLLAYTAARDGKLMPTTVNLTLLVGDIINSRLDHAESTGAAPPYFEVGRLDPVEADPVLLRQLLENLIDNSLRMMGPGVGPYLAIFCQPAPNGLLRIDILDNSVGIPPVQWHEIFTNFHRAKGSTSNGLELAICKRIVERHGGTIEATANPYATGTRMSFTLPAGRSAYARTLTSTGQLTP